MLRLKNEAQLEGIRRSCALLSELFERLRPLVKSGVTTGELDGFAYDFIVGRKGIPAFLGYLDYPATLCISVNEEVIHGIPGPRRLQDGDIVGVDCGINLEGFYSDAAYTHMIGRVDPEAEKLVRVTAECLERAVKAVMPGGRVHDISRAVFAHATAHGYGVVKPYCGHGVGFDVHEDPQVPNYVSAGPNPRLVPGMVLAIEPMICLGSGAVTELADGWTVVTVDRKPSAHFEHTVAVTENGVEVLTRW